MVLKISSANKNKKQSRTAKAFETFKQENMCDAEQIIRNDDPSLSDNEVTQRANAAVENLWNMSQSSKKKRSGPPPETPRSIPIDLTPVFDSEKVYMVEMKTGNVYEKRMTKAGLSPVVIGRWNSQNGITFYT